MASFISANETLTAGFNGSISRSMPKVIGRKLDESAGVNAGRVLAIAGTANLECQEPTSEALVKTAYGFSVWTPMEEDADLTDGSPHYANDQMVSIMTEGSMWVDCEGTCVAGKPVCVRFTSDGGSNTELGKVRADSDYPAGGITLTPAAPTASVSNTYSVELFDGTVRETYAFTSDATPTVAEIITGLVAKINAGTAFDAVDGTTVLTVTSVTGILEVSTNSNFAQSTPARAAILPGAYFTSSRTGAGLVEINFKRAGGI